MINAKEVLQAQLAGGLGLDRYADIMHGDPASPEFQRMRNGDSTTMICLLRQRMSIYPLSRLLPSYFG